MAVKQRRFSYSSRNTFGNCPKKYYHLFVAKDYKDDFSGPALAYGNELHTAMEVAMVRGRKLPKKFEHAQWALEFAKECTGLKMVERFLSVDRELKPCEGRGAGVFNTAKLDVLSLRAADADVVDYKTGKHSTDMTQLQDSAVMVFSHFPTVVRVTGHLVFTEHKDVVESAEFRREEVMDYVSSWYDVEDDVSECERLGHWQPSPTGLCNYCPIARTASTEGCPHHPSAR